MTFDSRETSIESGQPGKLYEFQLGTLRWRYTDGEADVLYDSQTYESSAISDDGLRQTGQTSADEFTIRVPDDSPIIALFRASTPALELGIVVRSFHYGEAEMRIYFTGVVRGVRRREPGEAELICQSDMASLDRPGLRLGYARGCTHSLYDLGCGVSSSLHQYPGTIITLTGTTVTATEWSAQADGFFAGGFIEFAIGGGEFDRRGIELHVGSVLTILGGTNGLQLASIITAYPGCPRNIAVCNSRFSNSANYGGFPSIPGKSPFDGDPIF